MLHWRIHSTTIAFPVRQAATTTATTMPIDHHQSVFWDIIGITIARLVKIWERFRWLGWRTGFASDSSQFFTRDIRNTMFERSNQFSTPFCSQSFVSPQTVTVATTTFIHIHPCHKITVRQRYSTKMLFSLSILPTIKCKSPPSISCHSIRKINFLAVLMDRLSFVYKTTDDSVQSMRRRKNKIKSWKKYLWGKEGSWTFRHREREKARTNEKRLFLAHVLWVWAIILIMC